MRTLDLADLIILTLSPFIGLGLASAAVFGGISAMSVAYGWYLKIGKSRIDARHREELELARLRDAAEKRWAAGDKGEVGPEEVK